ncbi:MAG: hypothetical protein ABIP06_06490 [Pyrinomonadaceae bacterium]
MTQAAKPLTPAERKAAERARHRAFGRVHREVWVHPEDMQKLERYVARLNKERE